MVDLQNMCVAIFPRGHTNSTVRDTKINFCFLRFTAADVPCRIIDPKYDEIAAIFNNAPEFHLHEFFLVENCLAPILLKAIWSNDVKNGAK